MSEKEGAPSESDLEKIGTAFVDTLGILDIIVGALLLYLVRLWAGPDISGRFPSTGMPVVDATLLGFAAALTGKATSIGVALFMAVVLLVSDGIGTKATKRLRILVAMIDPAFQDHAVDGARAILRTTAPEQNQVLERIRTESRCCYSAGLIAVGYTAHFLLHGGWALSLLFGVAFPIFVALGFLQQLDYFDSTADAVAAVLGARKDRTLSAENDAKNGGKLEASASSRSS